MSNEWQPISTAPKDSSWILAAMRTGRQHWRMVPKAVQDLIWKHYRPGQEINKKPTIEYIATAFVSVSCVALKEGKPLPGLGD